MTDSAATTSSAAPAAASSSAPSTSPSSSEAPTPSSNASEASGTPSQPSGGTPTQFDINSHLDAPVKLKVNGAEKEYTLAKLIQEAQKFEAANERFNKASEMEKRLAEQEKMFKENPRKAMEQLGIDPFEFSQMTLEEFLKEQEKTPEQRELEELRRFQQEHLTKQQQAEEARKQQEFQAHVQAKTQELDTIIPELIEKYGLDKDISSAQRIADYMLEAMDNGMDLTYDMAARLVKREQETYFKNMFSRYKPEQIYSLLGDEGFQKLNEYSLNRVKAPTQTQQQSQQQPQNPPFKQSQKKESLAEYNRRLREELGL